MALLLNQLPNQCALLQELILNIHLLILHDVKSFNGSWAPAKMRSQKARQGKYLAIQNQCARAHPYLSVICRDRAKVHWIAAASSFMAIPQAIRGCVGLWLDTHARTNIGCLWACWHLLKFILASFALQCKLDQAPKEIPSNLNQTACSCRRCATIQGCQKQMVFSSVFLEVT